MFRIVVLVFAVAFASAEPVGKPSGVLAAAVVSPAIAPVVVAARSSQYFARTYNYLAPSAVAPVTPVLNPVAAVIPQTARIITNVSPIAAVARLASPLVSPVLPAAPSIVSSPTVLGQAAPLAVQPAPLIRSSLPAKTARLASSSNVVPAGLAAPIQSVYSAPYLAASPALTATGFGINSFVRTPFIAPVKALPAPTIGAGTAPVNPDLPEVVDARISKFPSQNNQDVNPQNDDAVSIASAVRNANQQKEGFGSPSSRAGKTSAIPSRQYLAPLEQELLGRLQLIQNQDNNALNIARSFSITQAGRVPQLENIPKDRVAEDDPQLGNDQSDPPFPRSSTDFQNPQLRKTEKSRYNF